MFGVFMKKFFWDTWDNLGKLILVSIVSAVLNIAMWFLMTHLWMIYGHPENLNNINFFTLLIMSFFATISFPTVGAIYGFIKSATYNKSVKFRVFGEYFANLKRYFFKMLVICIINTAFYYVSFLSIQFYRNFVSGVVRFAFVGVVLWFMVFFSLMHIYMFPLLVYKGFSIVKTYKISAYLVLDNIVISFIVFVMNFVIWIISALSMVGILIIAGGLSASLNITLYRVVMTKYEDEERPPDIKENIKDYSAELELRSWKEIFKPWEGSGKK